MSTKEDPLFIESTPDVKPTHEEVFNEVLEHMIDVPIKGRKLGVKRNVMTIDYYVKEALKSFDRPLFESLKGWTRKGGSMEDLFSKFKLYNRKYGSLDSLDPVERQTMDLAMEITRRKFRLREKVPMQWIEEVKLEEKKSAGYPYFKPKGEVKDEAMKAARLLFHRIKRDGYWKLKESYPCTMAMRGGLSTVEDPKTRLVWMYSVVWTIVEQTFVQNVIAAYVALPGEESPLLTGKHGIYGQKWLAAQINEVCAGLGLDAKHYDSTIIPDLIRFAASVVEDNIDFHAYKDKDGIRFGGEGVAARAKHAYQQSVEHFIYTPMLLPNGRIVRKRGGVPSGSTYTNLFESIITYCVNIFTMLTLGKKIKALKTNGDDSGCVLKENQQPPTMEAIAEVWERIGLVLNTEKSVVAYIPSDMYMSGAYWDKLMPRRPTFELFLLALYCKTFVDCIDKSFSRVLGIFIAGGYRDIQYCKFFEHYQGGWDIPWKSNRLYSELEWVYKAYALPIKKDLAQAGTRRLGAFYVTHMFA